MNKLTFVLHPVVSQVNRAQELRIVDLEEHSFYIPDLDEIIEFFRAVPTEANLQAAKAYQDELKNRLSSINSFDELKFMDIEVEFE